MASQLVIAAFEAAQNRIVENSDFRSEQSADKARKYIDALNTLVALVPQRQQAGGTSGESIQWPIAEWAKLRLSAEQWLTARQSGRRLSYANPCAYRD